MNLLNRDKWLQFYRKVFPDTPLFGKIELGLRILLAVVVFAIFLAQAQHIFNIPIQKPYYTGKWDEPFAINAGINALREKGNPIFYNYGGSSVYPYSLVYYRYCKENNITPVYKVMDEEFAGKEMPIARKIYPVKPIYITRVIAHILFLLGGFLYVGLFAFLLLPAPFWLIPSFEPGHFISGYADQMLPEVHLGILAGLTSIGFVKAVFEKDTGRYFTWVVITAAAASLTVGAKINGFYILLLPISLLWRLIKEKYLNSRRLGMLAGAFMIPYFLLNPAILFDFNGYYNWLKAMNRLSGTQPGMWQQRAGAIFKFIGDLDVLYILPAILIIVLFILSCVLFGKRNPAAFAGYMFFLFFSFYTIANMKHQLFQRHFIFLLLPFNILVLYPLIHLYNKAPKSIKAGAALVCLVITLVVYPPVQTAESIAGLSGQSFKNDWKKESRDHLADFVLNENGTVYFYDYHGFSLPDTIHDRLIPFTDTGKLPGTLNKNEYVAFIRYKKAGIGEFNRYGEYNNTVKALMRDYRPVKVFGSPGGAHDINVMAPQANPTIILLKKK